MVDEANEDLPGFRPPREPMGPDPLDPGATTLHQPEEQETARPRVSGEPEIPSEPNRSAGSRTTTSSTTFSEVEEALEDIAAGGFMLATMGVNKLAERSTKRRTQRWLGTEDEAEKFGEAAGRIMARRVPDELVEKGDTADYIVMAGALLTYGIRTTLGLSAEEATAAAAEWVEEHVEPARPATPAPPPAAQPPRVVQPQRAPAGDAEEVQNAFGAVAATPAPPSVIQPGI
ncbi:MAG: hypothetical protein ABSF84_02825 [Acidimicrobiales bacterium]|jgi:hypothetical protein